MKTITPQEGKYSYTINDESKQDGKFKIPVVDVRDGATARDKVKAMLKAVNKNKGSKHFNETFSGVGRSYREHYDRLQ